ncbi:hypothetical protein N7510_008571 [Penicillium lagena]|uniref:uncharacterized protein n=1 Tax=Penicillium lagena TaxID=94218 RepID=UPI00253FD308|nr:uncharacterized protein N7510_008571 [Penicillium lagena]KAJ5605790.1 hypothetical protein N7510_008571 [Penicillium lagena]
MLSHAEECIKYGTATKNCLETPEILNMILARVDRRTLLTTAQRVSRSWSDLISNSPSIQKALFFTPIRNSEWGIKRKFFNPLLIEVFPSFFPARDGRQGSWFPLCDLPMVKDASLMARLVRKDASWRKMLVRQPPIFEIGIFKISSSREGDTARSSSIPADLKMQESGHDGIRMERLFEVLLLAHWSTQKIYWATEKSTGFHHSSQNITDEFYRNLNEFGLVLCESTVQQCTAGSLPSLRESSPSIVQIIREILIDNYSEYVLDVDIRSNDIKESELNGDEPVFCYRRGR